MLATLTLMLTVSAPAQNEAEQLFRKMEDQVARAKAVEAQVGMSVAGKNQKGTANITLFLAEGNKLRANVEIIDNDRKQLLGLVSDGKNIFPLNTPGLVTREPTPKQLNEVFATLLTRAQLVGLNEKELATKGFEKEKALAVSDFKLGKKEKVGDSEAQAVEYGLTVADGEKGTKFSVTVWIDTKTNLPVRRVKTTGEGERKVTITEEFKDFKLDGKIDAKQFELPKE